MAGAAATAPTGWDLRSVPKCDSFSGKEEDWLEWSFAFRSYAYVLGVGAQLRACEALPDPPETVDMDDPTERQSEMLYHVLVKLVKNKARKKAMSTEVGNGFKLWYELKKSYESVVLEGSRLC